IICVFFTCLKVMICLIVIVLFVSTMGTIFPQAIYIPENAASPDPEIYYEDKFGIFGKVYYQLGLYDLYSSWWYMILIALIGISLVIRSIDRFVTFRRALKMQTPTR